MYEKLITIGGVYNILLVVFHLMFWRIFNWHKDLRSLSFINRATMQVLNISLTFIFIIFSYISFAHTKELLNTPLGNSLLVSITILWIARAVQQVVFFKLKHWVSWGFTVFFLFGALLYGIPGMHYAFQ